MRKRSKDVMKHIPLQRIDYNRRTDKPAERDDGTGAIVWSALAIVGIFTVIYLWFFNF